MAGQSRGPKPRQVLEKLEPYVPGRPVEEVQLSYGLTRVIKMASNENPWGPSPMALEAIKRELDRVAMYPEGSCSQLRGALARRLGVTQDMITVSNGGDNVLMMIAQAFVEPGDQVVMATPTFPIYRSATLLMGGEPVEVPLRDFTHDLEAMARAVGPKTKAVVICNPNNPTATVVSREQLEAFLEQVGPAVLVVLDEVYREFAQAEDFPDGVELLKRGKTLVTVRSFSKLYGLAGLRVGYGVGPRELIEAINRVREPFPVNRLAQAAALGALEDEEFRRWVITETCKARKELALGLRALGLRCLESHTNFLFVDLQRDSQEVFEALLSRGIIIRPGGIWRTPTWCRITVGRPEENRQLLEALSQVLRG
ncbi:MAG: histidinol-phosphate transaminase [Thermodesulfobacteriota bacterium]